MTKRPRPESPQGELQPHSATAKIGNHTMASQIDDQTVFSQLDMDVPENALVEDSTIADDILDKRVNKQLSNQKEGSRHHFKSMRHYRLDHGICSDVVYTLASALLPAIFEDNQASLVADSLVANYLDTIKHNPWLVKMLIDAYTKGMYGNIRRIGLCGS